MKRRIYSALWLAAGIGIGLLSGAAITTAYSDQARPNYDQVVGQVGETTITRGQLAERAIALVGAKVLDGELKHQAYVTEAARRAGIVVTDAEVDQRLDEYHKLLIQYKELADLLGSESAFNATPRGVLETQFRTVLYAEKLLKVKITDADVQDCFISKLNRFYHPPMVKLTLIATNNEADARRAWNRLKDGEDPNFLSETYSAPDDLKKSKGELGWVPRSAMNPQVADAIFGAHDGKGLKPKECTEIIPYQNETTHGTDYLIFYIQDYQAAAEKKLDDPEVHAAVTLVTRVFKTAEMEDKWYEGKNDGAIYQTEWKRVKDLLDPAAVPVTVPAQK